MIYRVVLTGNRCKQGKKVWLRPYKRIILGSMKTLYLQFGNGAEGSTTPHLVFENGRHVQKMPIIAATIDFSRETGLVFIPRAIEEDTDGRPRRLLMETQSAEQFLESL